MEFKINLDAPIDEQPIPANAEQPEEKFNINLNAPTDMLPKDLMEQSKLPQFDFMGRPLPGSLAERKRVSENPLSAQVRAMENFDLTADMDGNRMAINESIAEAVGGFDYVEEERPDGSIVKTKRYRSITPEIVDQMDPATRTSMLERKDVELALKKSSIVQYQLAQDAEAAAILRGEINLLYSAEGAMATFTRLNKPRISAMSEAMGVEPSMEVGMLGGFFGGVQRGQLRDRSAIDMASAIVDLRANASAVGTMATEEFDETVNSEAIDLLKSARDYALRSEAVPRSARAENLMRRLAKVDDMSISEGIAEASDILASDVIGAAALIQEVLAEQGNTILAQTLSTLVGGPAAGIAVASAGVYGQEQFAFSPEARENIKKQFGYDLMTDKGLVAFSQDQKAVSTFLEFGAKRAVPIAAASAAGFGVLRAISKTNIMRLSKYAAGTFSEAGLQFTGESAAMLWSGQEFKLSEAILEAVAGAHPVSLGINTYTAGVSDFRDKSQAEQARKWLASGEATREVLAGMPAEKLARASDVLSEKLQSDGIDTVYIKASELDAFDQDGSVLETLGLASADVQKAVEEGGDVAIDATTYIRHILGKDGFDALMKHTRFAPTAPTAQEAEEYEQNGIGDQIAQALNDKTLARVSPSIDEEQLKNLNEDVLSIQRSVSEQINKTGVYDGQKADLFARLTAQRYASRAVRMTEETGQPVDALSLFMADNLQIVGAQRAEAQQQSFDQTIVDATASDGLIRSAAVKIKGKIYEGSKGQNHTQLTDEQGLSREDAEFGFVTKDGDFVDRFEAYDLAEASDQLTDAGKRARSTLPMLLAEQVLYQQAQEFGVTPEELKAELDAAGGDITQTPRFKEWFGDSKVVDADGKPLVVYHGSRADIDAFDPSKSSGGQGIYFTPDPKLAETYAMFAGVGGKPVTAGQNITPVYASIQNPKVIEDLTFWERLRKGKAETKTERRKRGAASAFLSSEMVAELRAAGHDGIINNVTGEVVAFDPTQIKSTFNRGTFDRNDPMVLNQDIAQAEAELGKAFSDERIPALEEAARRRSEGEITQSEYDAIVTELKPIRPYTTVPTPATEAQMRSALKAGQQERVGKGNQFVGDNVGLRLDIPAYTNHGTWVPTMHDPKGKPIAHEAAAKITGVSFTQPGDTAERKAARVGTGETSKSPFAQINGTLQSVDPASLQAEMKAALNDPAWTQVGYDPRRHTFFYDRSTQQPILSADEVIQVGPLVLAKNAQMAGKDDNFLFQDDVADFLQEFTSSQSEMSIDDMYADTDVLVKELGDALTQIAEQVPDVILKPAEVKKREKIEDKVKRKNYTSHTQITDVVRGALVTPGLENSGFIVEQLREIFGAENVLDEGWGVTPALYMDRKVLVRLSNGMISEVQLATQKMWDSRSKSGGNGHGLYTAARSLPAGPERAALFEQMQALYSEGIIASGSDAVGIVERSAYGNLFAKSSSEMDRPLSATSAKSTLTQDASLDTMAKEEVSSAITAGRPSQSTNNIGSPPQLPMSTIADQLGQSNIAEVPGASRKAPDGLAEVLKQQIKDNPEGFTMSLDGTDTPLSGFAFAPLKQTEIVLDTNEISDELINKLVSDIQSLMQSTDRDVYAGGWFDPITNKYYLDASFIFDNKEDALYAAAAADQLAIFDLGEFQDVGTQDALKSLRQDGTYSAEALNEQRGNQAELSRRFEEIRFPSQRPLGFFQEDIGNTAAEEMVEQAEAALTKIQEPTGGMGGTSLTRLYNDDYPKQRGADGRFEVRKGHRKSKLEISQEIHAERVEGRDTWTDENAAIIGDIMAIEALHAIMADGNAATWYRDKVEGAMKVAALVHPEIAYDARAATAFKFILAITSNGSTVTENSVNSFKVYESIGMEDYLPGGKKHNQPIRIPPAGFGKEVGAMKKAFEMWNEYTQEMGVDEFIQFLNQDFTAGDLKKAGYEVSGELVSEPVKGSVIFGSKIGGGFFQNLNGNFNSLTMDLWFMRSWGRWSGTLIPDIPASTKAKRFKRLRDMLTDSKQRKLSKLKVKLPTIEAAKKMTDDELGEIANLILRADSVDKGQGTFAKTTTKVGKDGKVVPARPELHLAAQRVSEGAKKVLDAPSGGGHRHFMRKAAAKALDALAEQGINLDLADLQALLWYPEKDLSTIMGNGTKRTAPTDYETEFSVLAKKGGFSDADIQGTILRDTDGSGEGTGSQPGQTRRTEDAGLTQGQGPRTTADGRFFLDQGGQKPRGSFVPSDLITDQDGNPVNLIQIFEKADPTTFLHESGHFWLEQLKADAQAVGGQFQRDFDVVVKWWGGRSLEVKDEAIRRARKKKNKEAVAVLEKMTDAQVKQYISKADLRGSSDPAAGFLSVAMHEQFARGVENYFSTGNSPSIGLASLFNAFKVWINSVYRIMGGMDVQFSPEVRGVLDRMITTDEEIEAAAGQYEMAALYDSAAEAGMTPKEFAKYHKSHAEALAQSKANQLAKSLREQRRETLQWWKDEEQKILPEVTTSVAKQRVYRLLYGITEGGLADGSTITEAERIPRINKKMMEDLLRAEGYTLLDLPRVGQKSVYVATTKEGESADPGAVAAAYGYDDVVTMIAELVDAKPFKEAVISALDRRMKDEHGSMDDTGDQEAIASIHGDHVAKVLAAELQALRTTEPAFKPAFIRQYAREQLSKMKTGDIKHHLFIAAERRHAKFAKQALKDGDRAKAYQHQFHRLVNHRLANEALRARKDIDKKTRYLQNFKNEKKKHPTVAPGYIAAIRDALAATDLLRPVSDRARMIAELKALNDFIETAKNDDGAIFEIPAWLVEKDALTNARDLSYQEFLEIHELVSSIEKQGKHAKRLLVGAETRDRKKVIAELVSSLETRDRKIVNRISDEHAGSPSGLSGVVETALTLVANADSQLLRVEFLLEALDGKPLGVWHQTLYQPFAAASVESNILSAEVAKLISDNFNALPKEIRKSMGKRVDVGSLGTPGMKMTRGELIMLALNVGNDSNLDKVIRGFGGDPKTNTRGAGWNINENLIDQALDQLTAEEWSLIRAIWDHAEKLWPKVSAIYEAENGVPPARVEPRTVVTRHGEFSGGYFPIMYDHRRPYDASSSRMENQTALETMQSTVGRGGVNSSMVKGRTGYAAPIKLDIDQLARSFNNTIHFLTHYDAVRNARKVINDPEVRFQLEDKVGKAYAKELENWVAALATNNQDKAPANFIERGGLWLMKNTTMAVLGASYTTLGAQALGLTVGLDRLMADQDTYGPIEAAVASADLAYGLSQSLNPDHYRSVVTGNDDTPPLSYFMKYRRDNYDREVRAILKGAKGRLTGGIFDIKNRSVTEWGMQAIAEAQFFSVDLPVWTASYNRALRSDPGDQAGAIAYADRTVRLSQSSGDLIDLAAVQREGKLTKLFTMFYTFFSALYAILRYVGTDAASNATTSPVSAVTRAATRAFVLLTLQGVGMGLIRGELPDWDPEDEDDPDMLDYLALQTALGAFGAVPFVRDIASGALGGYGYSMSPAGIFGDAFVKSVGSIEKMSKEGAMDDIEYTELIKRLKPLILLGGVATGLPAVQINRTLDGAAAYYDDSYNWHIGDLLRGYDPKVAERRD